jgi:hypothetical protein
MLLSHPLGQRVTFTRRPIRGVVHHRRRGNDKQILSRRGCIKEPSLLFPFSPFPFLLVDFNQRVRVVGFFPTRVGHSFLVGTFPFAHEKLSFWSLASFRAREVIHDDILVRLFLLLLLKLVGKILSIFSSFELLSRRFRRRQRRKVVET